jgi:hypothetical protein
MEPHSWVWGSGGGECRHSRSRSSRVHINWGHHPSTVFEMWNREGSHDAHGDCLNIAVRTAGRFTPDTPIRDEDPLFLRIPRAPACTTRASSRWDIQIPSSNYVPHSACPPLSGHRARPITHVMHASNTSTSKSSRLQHICLRSRLYRQRHHFSAN